MMGRNCINYWYAPVLTIWAAPSFTSARRLVVAVVRTKIHGNNIAHELVRLHSHLPLRLRVYVGVHVGNVGNRVMEGNCVRCMYFQINVLLRTCDANGFEIG